MPVSNAFYKRLVPGAGTLSNRNSSFELLRIIASAGVIVLHYNLKGLMALNQLGMEDGLNYFTLELLEIIFAGCVNLFIMIFGYFSNKNLSVDLKKPAELILQLLLFRFVIHSISVVCGNASFTAQGIVILLIPGEWFIVLYCALYLVTPYINKCINSLSDKDLKTMVVVLVLVFSVWNHANNIIELLTGIHIENRTNNGFGYTIISFVVCYVIGAAINRGVIRFRRPVWIFVVCVAAGMLASRLSLNYAVAYLSPFVIGQAACVLMVAEKFSFRSRIVNLLAKAPISVYITNLSLLRLFDFAANVQQSLYLMLAHMARVVVFIYFVSLAAQLVYTWVIDHLISKPFDKLRKIKIST